MPQLWRQIRERAFFSVGRERLRGELQQKEPAELLGAFPDL